jgi:hypothetical protein
VEPCEEILNPEQNPFQQNLIEIEQHLARLQTTFPEVLIDKYVPEYLAAIKTALNISTDQRAARGIAMIAGAEELIISSNNPVFYYLPHRLMWLMGDLPISTVEERALRFFHQNYESFILTELSEHFWELLIHSLLNEARTLPVSPKAVSFIDVNEHFLSLLSKYKNRTLRKRHLPAGVQLYQSVDDYRNLLSQIGQNIILPKMYADFKVIQLHSMVSRPREMRSAFLEAGYYRSAAHYFGILLKTDRR